jgi:hypothetical protein
MRHGEKSAGQQYYENICWKAINQSIGRAIRHQNDYASIVLIDSRYCNNSLSSLLDKLPQWIGDSFKQENPSTFTNKQIMESLVKVSCVFFKFFYGIFGTFYTLFYVFYFIKFYANKKN